MVWKKRAGRRDEAKTLPFPAEDVLRSGDHDPAAASLGRDTFEAAGDPAPLVLIVVDGRPTAAPAQAAFHALGYRTQVEQAGPDAVFALDAGAPDVVFVDCWRSKMDPLKFLSIAQKMHPNLGSSVIALVPADDDGFRRGLLQDAGVESVVTPPLTAGSVAGAVGQVRLRELAPIAAATVGEADDISVISDLPDPSKIQVLPSGQIHAPGEVLEGRYEVRGLFGKGGAAHVYRVYDRVRGEELALKLLKANALDPHAAPRFEREMRILVSLRNPSVVRTFDSGHLDGSPYFTMEALEGGTLRQFMRKVGSAEVAPEFAIELLLHICRGLAATHRMGIIHRDIKPSNLFVVGDGPLVKLTDFGIARDDNPSSAMTTLGVVVGTPGYVSPERLIIGGPHAPASDIFSLGVVGYELFARRRPFKGRNPADLLRAMTEETPMTLLKIDSRIPHSLDALLRSMIALEPAQRPSSVIEVATELRSIRSELRR
jgi:tRNA A-37 threonylcarbamoyl transferase component Bud32/CheY-like chemotaxis protein